MKSIPKVSQKKQGENSASNKLKIPVTLNGEQLKLIEGYQGILGNTKAEVIRNIVINWMLNNKTRGGENEKN